MTASAAADLLATIVAATRRIVEVRAGSASRRRRWPERAAAEAPRGGRFAAALTPTGPHQRHCRVQTPFAVARRAARDYDPVAIATRLRGRRRRGDFGAHRADVLRRCRWSIWRPCGRPSTCRCCARTSSCGVPAARSPGRRRRRGAADCRGAAAGGAEGAGRQRAALGLDVLVEVHDADELAIAHRRRRAHHRRQQPEPAHARGRRARVGDADRAYAAGRVAVSESGLRTRRRSRRGCGELATARS